MTTPTPDTMPTIATYRGRAIHAFQNEARIREIVCAEIDEVLDRLSDPGDLLTFASDASRSPEARLCAHDKIMTMTTAAAEGRRRAPIDAGRLAAVTAGLDCIEWVDPHYYDSILSSRMIDDAAPAPRPVEYRDALIAAQKAARA